MPHPFSQEIVPPRESISIQTVRIGNNFPNLSLDLRRQSFIRVDAKDPIMGSMIDRYIFLLLMPRPRVDEDAAAKCARNLDGLILALRIDHNDFIRPSDGLKACLQVSLFVQSDNGHRYFRHRENRDESNPHPFCEKEENPSNNPDPRIHFTVGQDSLPTEFSLLGP